MDATGFNDYNAQTHMSADYTKAIAREVLGLKNDDIELANTIKMVTLAENLHAISMIEGNKLVEDATRKRDLYNLSLTDTIEAGIKIAQIKFIEKKVNELRKQPIDAKVLEELTLRESLQRFQKSV